MAAITKGLQTFEDVRSRTAPAVRRGMVLYTRVYNIPRGAIASLRPVRGEAITLRHMPSDIVQTGYQQPRVMNVVQLEPRVSGRVTLQITFFRIRKYDGVD